MSGPWWFNLIWVLLLTVLVIRLGRWFFSLRRAQKEGRMDPDALWPPGRRDPGDDGP